MDKKLRDSLAKKEIQSYGRYGDSERARGPQAIEKLIRSRVEELCDEQFARPDREHRRVSVCNASGWFIEVSVSGLAELGRHDSTEPERHLCGLPPEDLVQLFLTLAAEAMDTVLALPWSAEWEAIMGPHDFYLFAGRPEMTDLHRAAALGDLAWVEEGLAAGADVNAPDKHGATPLHWAALTGRPEVCSRLLAAGADANATDRDEATPAEHAELSDEYTSREEARRLKRILESAQRK
jgi:hypothetical protein